MRLCCPLLAICRQCQLRLGGSSFAEVEKEPRFWYLASPGQSKHGGAGQCEEPCPSVSISLSFPAWPFLPYKCLALKSEELNQLTMFF